jgi:hypothetical protein
MTVTVEVKAIYLPQELNNPVYNDCYCRSEGDVFTTKLNNPVYNDCYCRSEGDVFTTSVKQSRMRQ